MTPRQPLLLVVAFFTLVLSTRALADDDEFASSPAWLDVGDARARASDGADAHADVARFAGLGFEWEAPSRRGPMRLAVSDASVASLPTNAVALPITTRVARAAVRAAYRAARFLPDDDVDGLASRARWNGLVPEVRLGARRIWDDSATLALTPGDDWRSSGATHANLWLEARAIFRLDRLLFADDELSVARLRLAQSQAAERLALRVVAMLGAWQRAWIERRAAPEGTVGALEASLRLNEIETALDVTTGGWFAEWRAHEAR